MGLEHHARITEYAEAQMLKEASESSYRKGGANASINGDSVSKEAVMNKLQRLESLTLKADEKKELRALYIDTNEAGRPRLVNTKYFGGIYDGNDSISKLWTEVFDYLNEAYDMDTIERIYINGDGAA